MLILVRHAEPAASPDTPPSTWPLTRDGRAAAERLRASLPADAFLASSNERKAWETLGDVAEVRRDPRFDEVRREGEGWRADFRDRRRRYVRGERLPGWEDRAEVARRFDEGVAAAVDEGDGRPVVVATHGVTMTLWLVRGGLVPPEEAVRFWEELAFPDVWRADTSSGTLERGGP